MEFHLWWLVLAQINYLYHCTENHIFFFQTSWKDSLSKKIVLEYNPSCIIGKGNISFSWKYDLTPKAENERWSFSKNTWKYDIFFKCPEKMVFSKGIALGHDLSGIIWKDDTFFQKTWYFFLGRKVRGDLFQDIHENMKFSVYTYGFYKRGTVAHCQKKSKMILSRKNTPEGDWRSILTF